MEKIVFVVGTPAEDKEDSCIVTKILNLLAKEKSSELTKEDWADIKNTHEECMNDFYKKHGAPFITNVPGFSKIKFKGPKMTIEEYYDIWDRYANPKTNRGERKSNTPVKESVKDTPNKPTSIEDVAGRLIGVQRPLPESIIYKMNNVLNEAMPLEDIENKATDFSLLYIIADIFDKYQITREELEEAIPKLDDMFSIISTTRNLGTAKDSPVKNTNNICPEIEESKEMMLSISGVLYQYAITPIEFKEEVFPEFEKLIIKIGEERKKSEESIYSKVSEIVSMLITILLPTNVNGENYSSPEEYAIIISNVADHVQKRIIDNGSLSTDYKLELLKLTHRVTQVYLYAMHHSEVLEYNGKGIDVVSYIVREISE